MSSQCRHAKSHTFAVRPTVLKQNSRSHALFQKFHDKFKNGKKKKKKLFYTSLSDTLSKKEVIFIYFPLVELLYFRLYFVRNTAVLLRDDKNMFIIGFFYLHNISVREIVVSAFTFQIEET